MPIESVVIRVADVARSVEFYRELLGGEVIGTPGDDGATLDFISGTVELIRLENGREPIWTDDDISRGFRHVGFKIDQMQPYVDAVAAAGIRVRFGPFDLGDGGSIFFFFDPDGTVVELVQGLTAFAEVFDPNLVEAEQALGIPSRPRLDHVGHTVASLDEAKAYYGALGFHDAGMIVAPGDARGMRMDYLRDGDTVVEVFSWSVPTQPNPPRIDTYGFSAAVVSGSPAGESVGTLPDGRVVVADPDGLPLIGHR